MRDIRDDLRHRLNRIALQRGELQQRIAWLGEMEGHIKAALEYEVMQSEGDQAFLFSEDAVETGRSPVAQFLREALSDLRPRTLDELKVAAGFRRLDFNGKNAGRVLHFALVGMAQSGLVESLGNGIWKLKQGTTAKKEEPEVQEIEIEMVDSDAPLM
jgi:hypothetical protein